MTGCGKYGKDTVSAVKRFQERNGLISDGYLGTSTKDLLMSGKAVANSIGLGDSGADVTRIQNFFTLVRQTRELRIDA